MNVILQKTLIILDLFHVKHFALFIFNYFYDE